MTALEKSRKDYRGKSINKLLGKQSAPIKYPPDSWTPLQKRWMQLRDKPIDQMTVEDMRFMIGQEHGAFYVIPFAIPLLEEDILAEGNYYPGDLLNAILSLPAKAWEDHQVLKQRITDLILANEEVLQEEDIAYQDFLKG